MRDAERVHCLGIPVREQAEVEIERLRPRDVGPRRVARDADRLHSDLARNPLSCHAGAPSRSFRSRTSRTGRRRAASARPPAARAWSSASFGPRKTVASGTRSPIASIRRGYTTPATGEPEQSAPGGRRAETARLMFATACTRAPCRKSHWSAVGHATSSHFASGDHDDVTEDARPGEEKPARHRDGRRRSCAPRCASAGAARRRTDASPVRTHPRGAPRPASTRCGRT